jgi:hypothetical protein
VPKDSKNQKNMRFGFEDGLIVIQRYLRRLRGAPSFILLTLRNSVNSSDPLCNLLYIWAILIRIFYDSESSPEVNPVNT